MKRRRSLEELFWSHVQRSGDHDCWTWMASYTGSGYGSWRGTGAHRVAYTLAKGAIPGGLLIRHLCHNRACVNPAHLAVGDEKDNARDTLLAGHLRSKLTWNDVIRIRHIFRDGDATVEQLARRYEVAEKTIWDVVMLRTWIPEP